MDKASKASLPGQINKQEANPRKENSKASLALICVLLAIATVVSYWPVVNSEFINYDDQDYVTENPHVQAGLTMQGVRWAFTSSYASNWHPLTWLSHMLDVQLFGKGPKGPHCINLLLHTANSLLLFLLLRKMTGAQWPSAFVAALFALHPLHVESVAWVAERKDVLSTFFGLLSLCAYASYAKTKQKNPKFKPFVYFLALLLFALSLMSKPMWVTLPFLMLLLDYWPLRRFEPSANQSVNLGAAASRLVSEKVPFLLLSAATCVATIWAQTQAIQPLERLSLSDRLANAVVAYARYLGKALWPSNLALPYLHPGHWAASQILSASFLVVGFSAAGLLLCRKSPSIFTGWFWFLGTMVPVLGVVQVGSQSMADRYMYLPSIGLFILFTFGGSWFLSSLKVPKIVTSGAVFLTLGVCSARTYEQAGYWHDSERLFKHSAAVTDGNFIALANAGGSLFKRGYLDDALELF